jgi:hypothetical protein
MYKISLLVCLAIVLLGTTLMSAQATRTWVSGVGDDANPCSRTAPCKTFAGAISKTAPGGEIDALDPGGFGALTITKSITLDGGGGQVASVLVAGTNGIVVAAGPTDVVIIRNLRLDGLLGNGSNAGNAGINGIRFISGKDLNVENCVIFGFNNNGIDVALNQNTQASVHVINTVVKNVGNVGIRATNAQAPPVHVGIDHTAVLVATGVNAMGIQGTDHTRTVISNSQAQDINGDGMRVDGSDSLMSIYQSDASFNGSGFTLAGNGSLNLAFSNASNNSSCQLNNAGISGNFVSYGNNRASGANCGTITGPISQL